MDLEKRIEAVEKKLAELLRRTPPSGKIVYDNKKHYVAIWKNEPYLLRYAGSGYVFVDIKSPTEYLQAGSETGQGAIDRALKCGESILTNIPPVIYTFDKGKEALQFMLTYL